MKRFSRFLIFVVFIGILSLLFSASPVHASESFRGTEGYAQFSQKPQDDFAKIIFLMNYYRKAPFMIVFNGSDFTPEFAFPFAQVYLFAHYRHEKAAPWIKKHCYRSPIGQKIVYLRFPGGKYRVARDVILEDLARLEKDLAEDQKNIAKA